MPGCRPSLQLVQFHSARVQAFVSEMRLSMLPENGAFPRPGKEAKPKRFLPRLKPDHYGAEVG